LTEIKDYKNKPVMAAIHFNDKSEILEVKSMYARRSNMKAYLKWKSEGLCLWENEKSDLVKSYLTTIAIATPKPPLHNEGTKINAKNKLSGLENDPKGTNQQPENIVVNRFEVDLNPVKPNPIEEPLTTTVKEEKKELIKSELFTPITKTESLNGIIRKKLIYRAI
jgi:hypothetical protein